MYSPDDIPISPTQTAASLASPLVGKRNAEAGPSSGGSFGREGTDGQGDGGNGNKERKRIKRARRACLPVR